jgi:hypothetical protein
MTEIILTEAQKKEDQDSRLNKFREGFIQLTKDTHITMKPQITPDGPANILIDTKYENPTPQQ